MNSNRGQYTSAPLYNMKNRRPVQPAGQGNGPSGKPPVPSRGNRRAGFLSILLSVGLPILFLLSLFIASFPLRVAFLGLTLICVALMWGLRAFSPSARSTLTIIYAALFVVVGVALLMSLQAPESRKESAVMADPQEVFSSETGPNALSSLMQSAPTETPESANAPTTTIAQQRLEEFLQYWANNNIPGMLSLCTPSWVAQQQSPEGELWNLMLNRRPVQYIVENAQGSDLDSTRTITLKVTFMKEGSTETAVNRMQVLMFRTNDQWYVDPQSLGGTVVDEAAEQQKLLQAQQNSIIGSTIAPTATPAPADSADALLLYYNADGGKYYHSKPNCSAVREEYWPLSSFYYSDLNTTKFKNLNRCPKCNPPARP